MTRFKSRYKIVAGIMIVISIIFLSKLFYIQVINDNYKFSANNNVLRYDVQQAIRGLIYDRDSNLIVSNTPAYDLMVIPKDIKNNFDTIGFCKLLNITIEEYKTKYNKAANYSKYKESVFIKHLSLEKSSTIAENLFQFQGFYLRKLTMRKYHYNSASHVIGYLGEVNNDKTRQDKYYTKGDLAGVNGVEAAYEYNLRGTKGMKIHLVDVHSRNQGKFQDGKLMKTFLKQTHPSEKN